MDLVGVAGNVVVVVVDAVMVAVAVTVAVVVPNSFTPRPDRFGNASAVAVVLTTKTATMQCFISQLGL